MTFIQIRTANKKYKAPRWHQWIQLACRL